MQEQINKMSNVVGATMGIAERVEAAQEVWPQSAASAGHAYVIFATHLSKPDAITHMQDNGVSFKDLTGAYTMQDDGLVIEESYIINERDLNKVQMLLTEQESILNLGPLERDGSRAAVLTYLENKTSTSEGSRGENRDASIGMFRQVSKEYALEQPNWTYDAYQDAYFVAE